MLLLRFILFTILIPGMVAYGIPGLLRQLWPWGVELGAFRFVGLAPMAAGLLFYFVSALSFLYEGKGTPAIWFARPLRFLIGEEPGTLVAGGIYRRTRNPMYLGVVFIVMGEFVYFQQVILLLYAIFLVLFFHCVVVFLEEPHLRKKHGRAYEEYMQRTSRWWGKGR